MHKLKNNLSEKYLLNLTNKLSEINQFETFPNPSVGAIGLDKNFSMYYGITGKKGSPHAERNLLQNLRPNLISSLFTSLEPCCHQGKNPPCTNLIIKKKVKNVITSSNDLDTRVSKKTQKILKKNKVNFKYVRLFSYPSYLHNFAKLKNRPYVLGKLATSNDYFTKHKSKRLFTSNEALKFAHLLRYQSDSILVGKNTINDDNPGLDCRVNGIEKKIAIFILNKDLYFKNEILKNKKLQGAFVFHTCKNQSLIKKLKKKFRLIYFDFENINFHKNLLHKIYNLGFRKLLIEGGKTTIEHFLENKCLDEFYHVNNKINFSTNGKINAKKIINSLKMTLVDTINLEHDLILNYKSQYVYRNNSLNR